MSARAPALAVVRTPARPGPGPMPETLLRGRDYALPQDVQDIAPDILRHRLVLSYDALADDIPADHIVARIMASVPLPSVAPRQASTPAVPSAPPQQVAAWPARP